MVLLSLLGSCTARTVGRASGATVGLRRLRDTQQTTFEGTAMKYIFLCFIMCKDMIILNLSESPGSMIIIYVNRRNAKQFVVWHGIWAAAWCCWAAAWRQHRSGDDTQQITFEGIIVHIFIFYYEQRHTYLNLSESPVIL